MNFTSAQMSAITTKDCSLLVAAGAGSGKTRVLTERIIDRLISKDNKTDITRFLVATFTTAAAKELSDRIRISLTKQSLLNPEDRCLTRNIALLPQAKIGTIDSFCYDLVKENFQKLGLPPKLRIAEETETDVMLTRIVGEVVEERMSSETGNDYFLTVYELFTGGKSGEQFEKNIIKFYKSLVNLPSIESYLNTAVQRYKEFADAGEIFDTYYGALIKEITIEALTYSIHETESLAEACKGEDIEVYEKFESAFESDIESDKILLCSVDKGYEQVLFNMSTLSYKTCQPKRYANPEYAVRVYDRLKDIREQVKQVKSEYYSVSSDVFKQCAGDCYNVMSEMQDIILKVDQRFCETKKAHGILNFSDVTRFTLNLLYDDPHKGIISDTARNLSKEFDEIYIDEYQDINPIQDMIFRAIAKNTDEGHECNRFMVGDSKQSIYAFRGARPEIFNDYRKTFKDVEELHAPGRKIFMQNNFRCAESVIDFTNLLFDRIMPEDYSVQDRLIYSKISEKEIKEPVKLILCNTDGMSDTKAGARMNCEAQAVFEEIKQLVTNPDIVGSNGIPYRLSDIAILVQTWDTAVFLENFFTSKGIPVICERGESFFERPEINLALSVLCSVDNPERDIYTVAFMRSASGAFNDDDLAEIRVRFPKGSMFSALSAYTNLPDADSELLRKINRFLSLHSELRTLSRNNSASEFLRKMYAQTDLINVCTGSLSGAFAGQSASVKKNNLMKLYDMAREYDKTVFKGLAAFIEYLYTKKNDSSIKSAVDMTQSDGVRIMTAHKSKGLEFPVCFVFGTDKEKRRSSESIVTSEKHGVAFKLKSLDKIACVGGNKGFVSVNTPFKELILSQLEKNEFTESKRVLYVALTRAVDRLYITSSAEKHEQLIDKVAENAQSCMQNGKSQLKWILGFLSENSGITKLKDNGEYLYKDSDGKVFLQANVVSFSDDIVDEENATDCKAKEQDAEYTVNYQLLEQIKDKISERQKTVSSIVAVPPKLTVSLLKHGLIEYEETDSVSAGQRKPLERPEFIEISVETTAAQKGTAMHVFMQFANFSCCENKGCAKEADRLLQEGFITQKQYDSLDIFKLNKFFETDLYKDIRRAEKVFRELRFNLRTKAQDVISNIPETDDFVLVQGVIDCFVRNSDGTYTVIDFKTDRVDKENGQEILKERYSSQLAFYCRAVQDITGAKVSRAVIFSFSLMKNVELDVTELLGK